MLAAARTTAVPDGVSGVMGPVSKLACPCCLYACPPASAKPPASHPMPLSLAVPGCRLTAASCRPAITEQPTRGRWGPASVAFSFATAATQAQQSPIRRLAASSPIDGRVPQQSCPACSVSRLQRCWVMAAQRGYELPQPPAPRYHLDVSGELGRFGAAERAARLLSGLRMP